MSTPSDADVFADIWRVHYTRLRGLLRHWTHDASLAEDLTSEAFTRAWRAWPKFCAEDEHENGKDGAIGAWLTTIAKHVLLDHVKRPAQRRRVFFPPDITEVPDDVRDFADDVANSIVVPRILARLNPYQREALELRYLDELSVAETAKRLGINDGAVKGLTYRALRAAQRNELGEDADDTPRRVHGRTTGRHTRAARVDA